MLEGDRAANLGGVSSGCGVLIGGRGGGRGLFGFVAALVVFDAGETEGAAAIGGEDVVGAVFGDAVIENIFVLAIGDGDARGEHFLMLLGEDVFLVAGLDDA